MTEGFPCEQDVCKPQTGNHDAFASFSVLGTQCSPAGEDKGPFSLQSRELGKWGGSLFFDVRPQGPQGGQEGQGYHLLLFPAGS